MDFWDSKEIPVDFPNSKDRFLGFLGSARLGRARLGSARFGSARNSWIPSLLARAPAPRASTPRQRTPRRGEWAGRPNQKWTYRHANARAHDFSSFHFDAAKQHLFAIRIVKWSEETVSCGSEIPQTKKKQSSFPQVSWPEWNFEPRGCSRPAQEIPRNIPKCPEVWRRF